MDQFNNREYLKFFYKSSKNRWLLDTLKTSRAISFRREMSRVIHKQINWIDQSKVSQITGLLKMAAPEFIQKVASLFYENRINRYISKEVIIEYMIYSGQKGGEAAYQKLGTSVDFKIQDQKYIRQFENRYDFLIDSVDQSTINWLAETIQHGVSEGMSAEEIVKLIRGRSPDVSLTRAEMIINAETSNAMSIVEMREYQDYGVTKKRWVTSGDGRVTEGCLYNESLGAVDMDYIYVSIDGIGRNTNKPPRFPFCRCMIEPELSSIQKPRDYRF